MAPTLQDRHVAREAQTKSASLSVSFGGYSHAGPKARNDDAFSAYLPDTEHVQKMKGAVACIADGISVSDRSHLASQLSVTQFIDDYYATPDSWSVETCASKVLRALNDWLSGQSRHTQSSAMVTTFSAGILKSQTLHIFHVGDTRIYRLRNGDLDQLTRDHAVNDTLTSALGMDPRLVVDYSRHETLAGDVILLATDGLSVFSNRTLAEILGDVLAKSKTLDEAGTALCDAALQAGSNDNVTCGLMRVETLPLESVGEAIARVQTQTIPPVLKPGNVIDDYKVLSVEHSGTRSHIYRVQCQETEDVFILKAPSMNFVDDAVYLEGFIREKWVGRRLNHPGLMKVLPGRETSDFLYAVCEHVKGVTLRDWMEENPSPSLAQARDILADIIPPLRAMHRMGVVHRDLKPENIMITHSGETKIIDYGTVQVAGISEIGSPIVEEHAVGSVNYSAPEYILGRMATTQSDLFSLGAITYELLAGSCPYADKSQDIKRPTRFDQWTYEPLKAKRPDLPNWACYAVDKACEADPKNRYEQMSAFLHDLTKPGSWARQKENGAPLIERNPVAFWKGLCLILLLANIISILLFSQTSSY